jgi:hypothetical protein
VRKSGRLKPMIRGTYRKFNIVFLDFFLLILLGTGSILLSACSAAATPLGATATHPLPSAAPTQAISPSATLAPTLTQTPTPLPATATPVPEAKRPLYTLKAGFNYGRHYLSVSETIDYTNQTGQTLSDMMLAVEPNAHAGAFKLGALKASGEEIKNFVLESNHLRFSLPQPLADGKSIQLALDYELFLPFIPPATPDQRSVIFGYSARQENLVDWYPYVPPFQKDGGWVIHNPWYYGEHQVYEVADFQVEVNLVSPPANLVLAGASQPEVNGNRYTYKLNSARNFTFSASNMYAVYATVVGNTTITSYSFPFDAATGRVALNDAAKALEVYNRTFGAYPHASLAVVEADFHDGMEYDGLYFLSDAFYSTYDGSPKGYLTMIGVHETAHQWWYARVAEDQALEPWLDESLATYSELIYYQSVYPELTSWWWSYRVDYFKPAGWVNLRIYDYGGSYPYRDGVYLRGARFLDQVRQKVGDQAFFDLLKDYATRYQGKLVTAQNFFDCLKLHSTVDISDIVKAYFKP